MASDQTITVYKGDRSIQVMPDAYKEATGKGWSRQKPEAPTSPAPGAAPAAQGTGAPTAQPNPQPSPSPAPQAQSKGAEKAGAFFKGVGSGLNPFHDATDEMANKGTMGTAGNMAADTFNMREIFNRITDHDYAGAAGLTTGSAIGLFGPSEVKAGGKALKGAGLALRGAKESKMGAKAVRAATALSRNFKLNADTARFASRVTVPLFDALDKRFEVVHKALEKQAITVTPQIEQMARRIASRSELPTVRKIGEELAGKAKAGFSSARSALGYKEAEGYRRTLEQLTSRESKQWKPHVHALAKMLDEEIDKLAKTHGVDVLRTEQRKVYKELSDLTLAISKDAKQKISAVKPFVDMAAAKFGGESGFLGKIGAAMGSEVLNHLSPELRVEAERLAKKLGVKAEDLVNKPGAMEKMGGAMQKAGGVAGPGFKAGRVATGAMSGSSQTLDDAPQ